MRAARWSLLGMMALAATLTPHRSFSQAQPQGTPANAAAGVLVPTSTNAAAVAELRSAMDDYFAWSWKTGLAHASRAVEMDPAFGLARMWRQVYVGGPTAAAESQRAAVDAASASVGEALLALANRESTAGRPANMRKILETAAELLPNDPTVALWYAANLTDTARVNALRAIARKYTDNVGARIFLAFYLAPSGITVDSSARANADEALRVAGEAVRLAPNSGAPHALMGHVLHALGRNDEAKQHLAAAVSMTPKMWYAYDILGDIHAREGNVAQQRAAADSAAAWATAVGTIYNERRIRAATWVSEGNVAQAMTELAQIVKELEAIDARGQLAATHLWAAILAAGARDSAGALAHVAEARKYQPAAGTLADNEVIVNALIGNGPEARRALDDYIRTRQPETPQNRVTRTQDIHRATGLTLLAEKKPQEAIAELRQGGPNPYAALGIIEAYRQMKKTKEADTERTGFLARGEFTGNSSATPIIRYRALKK